MTAERRLAIIGGGMGGIATAYLCDGDWSTDLFEARAELGGNVKTVIVHDDDQPVAIDIGAESFNRGTHPLYMALLQEIGAIDPVDGSADVRIVTPSTVSIFDAVSRRPLFVSTHPARTPRYALDFLRFTRAARRFVLADASPAVTVGDWVDALPVSASFRDRVLLPWLASLTCCSVTMVREQSALAFLLLFAPVFPRNPVRLPRAYGADIGLAGILRLLVARCERLAVHLDATVTRLDRIDGDWFVETAHGRFGPYERVVVNAPPHASRSFLGALPSELLDILGRLTYYPTRMIVHRDPGYMPADRADWCSHNAAVFGDACEATVWAGSSRTNTTTGEAVGLFKSWASNRHAEARDVLAEHTFLHPSLTPDTLRATRELGRWQGVEGVHFTGHFTTVTDLQETALYSGMTVASALSPDSPRVRALRRRLADAGRPNIAYDIADDIADDMADVPSAPVAGHSDPGG